VLVVTVGRRRSRLSVDVRRRGRADHSLPAASASRAGNRGIGGVILQLLKPPSAPEHRRRRHAVDHTTPTWSPVGPSIRRSGRWRQTWSARGRNFFLRSVLCRSVPSRIHASRSVSSSPQFPTWTAKIAVTLLRHAWHTALLHGEALGSTQGVRFGPGSAVAIGRRRHFRCPRRRAPSRARRGGRSSRGRLGLGAGTGRASGARGPSSP
jgi:hypothetical protein